MLRGNSRKIGNYYPCLALTQAVQFCGVHRQKHNRVSLLAGLAYDSSWQCTRATITAPYTDPATTVRYPSHGDDSSRPYRCDRCPKRYTQKTSLNVHMRHHTQERPYQCNWCPMRFYKKDGLTLHLRTHTGEKPYRCDQCWESFSQKSTLKRHQRRHTGERPYRCDRCHKDFSRLYGLTLHKRQQVCQFPP